MKKYVIGSLLMGFTLVGVLALLHFIAIKPESLSWWRWTEHAFNRYQTFIVGLGAIVVAVLSVQKVTDQITAQREQHISDKKFALRREFNAINECIAIAEKIAHPPLIQGIAKYFNEGNPLIRTYTETIIDHHRPELPGEVAEAVDDLHKAIEKFNDFVRNEHKNTLADVEEKELLRAMVHHSAVYLLNRAKISKEDLQQFLK